MTTTASKQALLIREIAGPEKMPWVRIAYTLVAPAEMSLRERNITMHKQSHHNKLYPGTHITLSSDVFASWSDKYQIVFLFPIPLHNLQAYLSAAWQIVPQVSAMSSTRMATRPVTSPTRTIRSTSFAFFLSL